MISPAGHRVIVEPKLPDGMTIDDEGNLVSKSSGIVMGSVESRREQDSQIMGKVVGIGPTAFKGIGAIEKHTKDGDVTIVEAIGAPWCKLGDLVYYAKHVGLRVVDPDSPQRILYLIHDKDVLALVGESADDE